MVKEENGYEIMEIKIMTGRSKRGGKRQTKKKNNNSTREKVVEHNPPPVAEGLSDENQTDHHSATSLECQPLPPDELYFKNTKFTKSCKIPSKCSVSGTVNLLKKLTPKDESPELDWFKNHPQFCHIFHMPDEPNLRLLDRHFGSHKEITMESVREKLLSMSACGDRLRMAVLYFLGTVIRAKARYNAPFDSFILRVVNDVEISLNARFRERVAGCFSSCPRMCKKRFQSNSMKGYSLQDLYDTLGNTTVFNSVLVPSVDEEPLMARILEGESDYENEGQGLYELDVAAREFPKKKDKGKGKVNEEASSSDHGLEDVLKEVEERLMASLSEVIVKVETMDNKLGVVEKSHVILKRRSKRMKAMEKRLEGIERTQDHLKLKAKKKKTLEERLDGIEKEMNKHEKEKENADSFEYQTLDTFWNDGRYNSNGVNPTDEKVSEEEAQKEDKNFEKEKGPEAEAQAEEAQKKDIGSRKRKNLRLKLKLKRLRKKIKVLRKRKNLRLKLKLKSLRKKIKEIGTEKAETEKEVETEKEDEKLEKEAEKEPKDTPTLPRGSTKAATNRSIAEWTPRTRFVLSWDEAKETQQQWTLSLCKSNDVGDEGAPGVDETDEGAPGVDETDEEALVVDETDERAPAVDETDEGAHAVDETDEGDPARIGVKHRR
ncbi:uncharacterized protein At3g43530-like [Raphanus sativus]|uniref:Uncharacterized protein At3g43530-like n=1 Tax=Raphanus sativus TaxID=3726 RepID=A0A9W3D887_RAPSA|nr:uncharacterized protein At3g43530-like [Raphanus sativus]